MDALIHITLNSGDARMSPRNEVHDGIVTRLKPIVAAGGGAVSGLQFEFESAEVFTLGWEPGVPAVRCYLAKQPNVALWMQAGGQGNEPATP